jgi:hypothetical protein
MEKEYRFKESKVASISQMVGIGIFLLGFASIIVTLILSFFVDSIDVSHGLGIFLLSLPIAMVFVIIHFFTSKRDKFTSDFLKEIKLELAQAKTINELQSILDKLWDEAVDENKMIRLSYPLDIKKLFIIIDSFSVYLNFI